jgi:hypothetical protein
VASFGFFFILNLYIKEVSTVALTMQLNSNTATHIIAGEVDFGWILHDFNEAHKYSRHNNMNDKIKLDFFFPSFPRYNYKLITYTHGLIDISKILKPIEIVNSNSGYMSFI